MRHLARRNRVGGSVFLGLAALLILGAVGQTAQAAEAASNKASDDYNMAIWLYTSKKYGLAAEEFASFLKKYPTHEKAAEARLGMARALRHVGKNDETIAALTELRAKHPKFEKMAETLFYLGQAQVAVGNTKEAAATFDKLTRDHAKHYLADWARAQRGEALVLLKDYDGVEKTLAPLIEKFLTGKNADKRLKTERERLRKMAPAWQPDSTPFWSGPT